MSSSEADRPPETCWTRKSLFQVGLLLTLCVTVPFFIAMVIVYSLSLTVGRDNDRCHRMCALLWDWEILYNTDGHSDYEDIVDFEWTTRRSHKTVQKTLRGKIDVSTCDPEVEDPTGLAPTTTTTTTTTVEDPPGPAPTTTTTTTVEDPPGPAPTTTITTVEDPPQEGPKRVPD